MFEKLKKMGVFEGVALFPIALSDIVSTCWH